MPETIVPDTDRVLRAALTPLHGVNVRDPTGTGDGSWIVEGYAAVFDSTTVLYDSAGCKVEESIAPGAFTDVLATDPLVHLNFGHDMQTVVASTKAPGPICRLTLSQQGRGLWFSSRVDPADPDAVRMAVKMRNGVVNQASFAFRIGAEDFACTTDPQTGKTTESYRITNVSDLFDVCVAAQGAYSDTSSYIRSLVGPFGRSQQEGRPHRTAPVGENDVAPVVGVVDPSPVDLAVHRERARAKQSARRRLKEATRAHT